jgi:dTDP-4-amino-4,6-dideoxygalactose transaminase
MSNFRIPLSDLDYGPEEEAAVLRVLRSKWLSMGPEVAAFEKRFEELVGVKHALAVSNGTAALHLAYLAAELGPGDEIIQPAINFVAAANMTVAVGARPVFADIVDLEEPTIDPADVERRVTADTKAVVVMHYGGYFCRMAEIDAICKRHRLMLIEDACHAVGARYLDPQQRPPHGRMAGSIGDVACFSFFSNKNLPVGEGGMVATNRDDIAERLRLLRSHGMTTLTWDRHRGHASSYDVLTHGYNYRFHEIGAALGQCQLSKLLRNNQLRSERVSAYRRHLGALPGWIVPFGRYQGESACHLMPVVAPTAEAREKAVGVLSEKRIQTSLHYPAIPGFSGFKPHQAEIPERSAAYASRVITLPLFPSLPLGEVASICGQIVQGQSPGVP